MSYPNLSALLEAIIYLAKEPVSIDAIHKALPEVDRDTVEPDRGPAGLWDNCSHAERGDNGEQFPSRFDQFASSRPQPLSA